MNSKNEKTEAFGKLLDIMDELREKCPWDKKQTLESIRHLTLEETYELSDAILKKDTLAIKEELGDILLHIIFYSKIASETKQFDIKGVIDSLCNKLIQRHPHIYGNTKVNSEEEVRQNWQKLKLKEKNNDSVLSGVPVSLPSLIKSMRIQEKARESGFDWEEKSQVWEKVEEEMSEFRACFHESGNFNTEEAENEFGDLLFSLINYARFIGINPSDALEKTNNKFIKRFQHIEKSARSQGRDLHDMTLDEMDILWEEAKKI